MSINFHCESCNAPIRVRDEFAGRRAKCIKCSHVNTVPAPAHVSLQTPVPRDALSALAAASQQDDTYVDHESTEDADASAPLPLPAHQPSYASAKSRHTIVRIKNYTFLRILGYTFHVIAILFILSGLTLIALTLYSGASASSSLRSSNPLYLSGFLSGYFIILTFFAALSQFATGAFLLALADIATNSWHQRNTLNHLLTK